MQLKDNIISEIIADKQLVRGIEDLHDRSPFTIKMWLKNNNPALCRFDSLSLIAKSLNKEVDELVTKT